MKLYTRSSYLSVGAAPSFLDDQHRILFTYFCSLIRGMKTALVDADEDLHLLLEAELLTYDRGKELRGEKWDSEAPRRAKKHLRSFLISLCSVLDCVSELIALLLPSQIKGLKLGRAEFAKVEEWLSQEAPVLPTVALPLQLRTRELYDALRPIVVREGPAKEWLPVLRLLRNKSAHLGTEIFREMGFHDSKGVFYTFLPKSWPFFWEKHIDRPNTPKANQSTMEEITAPLMRQDKVSYVVDLKKEVLRLADAALEVLDSTYIESETFAVKSVLIDMLEENHRGYEFQAFEVICSSTP